MIRYALKCANDHNFESWFQSAAAFDTLKKTGHLNCVICGTGDVEKTLMAPRVTSSKAVTSEGAPMDSPLSKPQSPEENALSKVREHIEKNSEYVGMNFAAEARKMNDGDAEVRSIYGEAKPEEAKKLIEDGVPVAPLPFVPNRKTN
ncbi:DUF1178 family protein [Parasulfitobacter algicola]|uniref:DUF1178 family protein n=1 Tax=Parasulfitobacter algicola TaxID=2614809 RepID=A0ABX2IPA2_9RHOB|nr:DUF1178 family protein [Sulfitobacter algicola]NSX54721.1 DUF1178 family protein [Sulfitobacter algicola]